MKSVITYNYNWSWVDRLVFAQLPDIMQTRCWKFIELTQLYCLLISF